MEKLKIAIWHGEGGSVFRVLDGDKQACSTSRRDVADAFISGYEYFREQLDWELRKAQEEEG